MEKSLKHISIIFLFLYLLLTLTNTDKFIYQFIEKVYLQHLLSIGLVSIILIDLIFNKKNAINWGNPIVIVSWCFYIAIFTIINGKAEYYYVTYLINVCMIIISFTYLINAGHLNTISLFVILTILNVIISIISIFQYYELVASNSDNFLVTGPFDNPNQSAIIVTLTIPAIVYLISHFKKFRIALFVVIVLSVVALIHLQCRTAIVGFLVITILYLLTTNMIRKLKNFKIGIFLIFFIGIASLAYLQLQKSSSTEGRKMIWKITQSMIAEKPFSGTGYGFFQKEFNLKQAEYFNVEDRAIEEKMNAGYTAMAYNEFLQQAAMGGILGLIFYLLMIGTLLLGAWRLKYTNFSLFPAIAAFITMSMMNYSIEIPVVFLVIGVYASLILSDSVNKFKQIILNRIISTVLLILCLGFVVFSIQKFNAQRDLKKAKEFVQDNRLYEANKILTNIESSISTSEAYFNCKAAYHFKINEPYKSLFFFQKAMIFTSSVSLYINAGNMAEITGNKLYAEECYKIAKGIEPHMFRPIVMLMNYYQRNNYKEKANEMAHAIIDLPPKIDSDKVSLYKNLAKSQLNNTNQP